MFTSSGTSPAGLFASAGTGSRDSLTVSPRAAYQDLLWERAAVVDVEDLQASALRTGRPVLLMCADGSQSRLLAETLRAGGHDNVYAVRGGRRAWARLHLPDVA
ncbi:hypothetical protein G9U51_15435 [Calidifontibacter sp. DB0510]|uniref:Rhodanese domain-containing protein n=1 Tax=Metallococcus carri TaxID=1656884 RepID=A0A967B429_9MICO|nr:rhodanese-like domain-containing protein [Metallococcus carri]NHN57163.1 hypothetical protein [Metallococcus carri]NOP38034.1 hypothetical protein [Calidifontibacter sp. DB2511S]